jgi:hypothetical protein
LIIIATRFMWKVEKTLGKLGTSEEIILYIIVLTTIEFPTKGVRGKGIVRVSEDVDYNLPIIKKIVIKYLGSTENPMAKGIIDSIRDRSAVLLEITPRFYASWDHGKGKM